MKGKALRRFAAHTGQLLEFVDEASHGLGKLGQRDLVGIVGNYAAATRLSRSTVPTAGLRPRLTQMSPQSG